MFEIQAFSPYGYPANADVSSSVSCPATNGYQGALAGQGNARRHFFAVFVRGFIGGLAARDIQPLRFYQAGKLDQVIARPLGEAIEFTAANEHAPARLRLPISTLSIITDQVL